MVRVEGWWVLVCVGGEALLLVLLLMVGEKLLMLVATFYLNPLVGMKVVGDYSMACTSC